MTFTSLQTLNENKSQGPDNLHPKMFKECAKDLSTSLQIIFNMSLREIKFLENRGKQQNQQYIENDAKSRKTSTDQYL